MSDTLLNNELQLPMCVVVTTHVLLLPMCVLVTYFCVTVLTET